MNILLSPAEVYECAAHLKRNTEKQRKKSMINIHDILTSTQFAAVIALVATAVIAIVLRPKSHKEKHHPSK